MAIETPYDERSSPLEIAMYSKARNAAIAFIDAGGNPNRGYFDRPLDAAILSGDVELVKLFVNHGADTYNDHLRGCYTAIEPAIAANKPEIVRVLLNCGDLSEAIAIQGMDVDVAYCDPWDPFLLWMAVETACVNGSGGAIVKILLQEGADPRIPDEKGRRAIDIAQQHKRKDLVDLIKSFPASR